jgi:4'-phosphopantetheinyl transferase
MTQACLAHRPLLSAGEIHVWNVRLDDDDHQATAGSLRLLDDEERARAARFASERDRVRFIQAHGVLRQVLAGYCDADAASLAFASNRHGKPSLVPRTNARHLHFSLSHSGDRCMLAVRRDHPIGVDVEKLRDLPQAIAIAQRWFTPVESAALAVLQGTERRDAFFVLWAHKEAMVKALGVSLPANLGRIAFDLDRLGKPQLAAWKRDRSIAQRWCVVGLDPAPSQVAAVASAQPIRSLTSWNWNARGGESCRSARVRETTSDGSEPWTSTGNCAMFAT